ncbi:MAG: alpha/beta hydrolase [Ignavibacteria bacterium]|jgi:pimeloyl-ACP methyl ester carboxylesterase|nr:alpha/beta hydrolase [Ignavibacteria bacterium]MCU7501685.1 alpha/beta hydrolase [Ignavibacteria bacterium]MCU7516908.1 alpha/beta hydrolase [Ignavibacteria bacterium]
MIIKDFSLAAGPDDKIILSGYGLENIGSKACIIFVHGFKGFKDWGFGPYLARYFAEKGMCVLTFNFSHNGIGENPLEFTEMDKFASNTYSREVSELSTVIDAYGNGYFGAVESSRLVVLGHSRGGAISLLAASRKASVKAVALWASVSRLNRYSERQKKEWLKKGFMEVKNQRTGQIMRLNAALLEDLERNSGDLLNIKKAVETLNRPLLIAHGEQDLAVPIREGEELFGWSDKSRTEFFKLYATGHTFDIKHPFEGSNEKFERLLKKTYDFIIKNVN